MLPFDGVHPRGGQDIELNGEHEDQKQGQDVDRRCRVGKDPQAAQALDDRTQRAGPLFQLVRQHADKRRDQGQEQRHKHRRAQEDERVGQAQPDDLGDRSCHRPRDRPVHLWPHLQLLGGIGEQRCPQHANQEQGHGEGKEQEQYPARVL